MVSWIFIVVLVLIGLFMLKMNAFRHRFFVIILILFALFLYLTITYVNKQNNIDFSTTEGLWKSLKVYSGWLANGFQNAKTLTSNALYMDWKSTNGTFKSEKYQNENPELNSKNKQASVTFAK